MRRQRRRWRSWRPPVRAARACPPPRRGGVPAKSPPGSAGGGAASLTRARWAGVAVVGAAGAVGAVVPRPALRADADKRRSEMREVVAVICDLAAVVVAAGEDTDGALMEAAGAGQGWAFDMVRRVLATTSTRR